MTTAKRVLSLAGPLAASAIAAQIWTVRVEEPTGLYRRTNEAVAISLDKLGGHGAGFTVTAPDGREIPWQVSAGQLLFPVSLIPGELPLYKVACCDSKPTPRFTNPITLRRLGINRAEFGNDLFRAVIDLSSAGIVEAYSLRAGPQRSLNFVETSPETREGLKGDIHENSPSALKALPPPIPGIPGENSGWTTLGGDGPFTTVELLESGPIRGRLRLTRAGESWDITWAAASPAFRWKASRGFRFAAISALPYLPFNRCLGGSEYDGPTGPGEPEPAPNEITPRNWPKLPGGHIVYYTPEENYGALGVLSLDSGLAWIGACSRRLLAQKPEGAAEIAITFPAWQGKDTVLSARMENRILRQPVLTQVSSAGEGALDIRTPAPREPEQRASQRAPTPFGPETFPLDGEWQLAWAEKGQGPPRDGWRTVKVPGTAHAQWLDPAKLYTRDAEWVSEKEWWYRRSFRTPSAFSGKRLRLQFEATDYYADTYLNGEYLGRHEGYIDPYEYDITTQARPNNELLVRVWTPIHYYWKHRPYTVKGAYGAVDQKPDDITALGITRPVRLVASAGPVIQDVAVNTRLTDKGAEVEVALQSTSADSRFTWELTLSPRNFNSPDRIQVRAPARASRLVIPVANPQLWWTWDHGTPNLYTLDIRLLNAQGQALDGQSLAIGIREIEKIGWNFYLNRKKLFIRGTNYYYHLFMSEMDRAKYERDMKLMLGMNVNMVRVHCHFSNREFYELADENGVLVWQDFLEAWYPHDRAFSLRAAALYDNHLRYVRNHPSVALWATSDEEDLENYRDITKHLAPRPFYLDPQRRPVVRSTGRFGDAHIYHGWYDGSLWEYTQMTQPFVSELGATSLPNYETLIKFMPDQWPIRDHPDEWIWRRLQISEAMRAWGDPAGMSLKDYIPQTQAYVARLFQIALERQRRRKRDGAGGILHFHAIDIWPSVTMAAIDIDRVPTKTYDTVRRSFAPVAALFEYDRDRWKTSQPFQCGLWAVNDRWDPLPNATLRWKITGSAAGLPSGQFPVSLPADSVERLGDAQWTPSTPGAYALHAELLDAQGRLISENFYEFTVTP